MITRKGPSAGPAGHCQSSVRGTVAKPFGSWFKQLANWVQSFKPNAPPGPAPCAVGAPHVSRNSGALSCAPLAGGRSSPAFRSLWLVCGPPRPAAAAAPSRDCPAQGKSKKYSRGPYTHTARTRQRHSRLTHSHHTGATHPCTHRALTDRHTHCTQGPRHHERLSRKQKPNVGSGVRYRTVRTSYIAVGT